MPIKNLSIARDFTRHPAGRYRSDGPYSGEQFRDDFLVPAMETGDKVKIDLDGVRGFGSSFLEEAFGGLVRKGYSPESVLAIFTLQSSDPSIVAEIEDYIRHGADGIR